MNRKILLITIASLMLSAFVIDLALARRNRAINNYISALPKADNGVQTQTTCEEQIAQNSSINKTQILTLHERANLLNVFTKLRIPGFVISEFEIGKTFTYQKEEDDDSGSMTGYPMQGVAEGLTPADEETFNLQLLQMQQASGVQSIMITPVKLRFDTNAGNMAAFLKRISTEMPYLHSIRKADIIFGEKDRQRIKGTMTLFFPCIDAMPAKPVASTLQDEKKQDSDTETVEPKKLIDEKEVSDEK